MQKQCLSSRIVEGRKEGREGEREGERKTNVISSPIFVLEIIS
jgi:hypothetical protein